MVRAAREHPVHEVQDAIHRSGPNKRRAVEALEAERLDRLDRPDVEDDLATRPITHVIADLARNLGIDVQLDQQVVAPNVSVIRSPEPPDPKTSGPSTRPVRVPENNAEAVAKVGHRVSKPELRPPKQ